jgi:hypothetical protein
VGGDFSCWFNKLITLEGAPQFVGGSFDCYYNRLTSLIGAPQSVGNLFHIDLSFISKEHYQIIIPQMEELIERGIKINKPEKFYYPYKEKYYINRLIEII